MPFKPIRKRSHVLLTSCLAGLLSLTGPSAIANPPGELGLRSAPVLDASAGGTDAAGDALMLGAGDKVSIQVQQRKDLSGDYAIKADGSLLIPFVGTIMAEGRTPEAVEIELSRMLQNAGGVPPLVSVDVAEWRPVYVVGAVDKPGSFPFRPRMTALHALALAGGVYRPPLGTAMLDASRERWQQREAIGKLKLALARQARLEAERAGSTSITVPDQLKSLADAREAEGLIASETRLMQQRTGTFSNVSKSNVRASELGKAEIKALQEELEQVNVQIKLIEDNLSNLNKLEKSGLTTSIRVNDLRRQSADLEGEKRRIQSNIARAEQSLTISERERTQHELERTLKVEQELGATRDEVRMLQDTVSASGEAVDRLTAAGTAGGWSDDQSIGYVVIRRGRDGMVSMPVGENEELRPGDTVRVTSRAGTIKGPPAMLSN